MGNLLECEYPERLFVFANRSSFITDHNLRVSGRLFSATGVGPGGYDTLPFILNPAWGGAVSPYLSGAIVGYRAEYDAELVRRKYAPDAPSRLTSIFAFGDRESCERAAAAYDWSLDQVEEFRLVPSKDLNVWRVNMEIVSLARGVYGRAAWDSEGMEAFWRAYWGGGDSFTVEVPQPPGSIMMTSGCLWEYLIEGSIELVP